MSVPAHSVEIQGDLKRTYTRIERNVIQGSTRVTIISMHHKNNGREDALRAIIPDQKSEKEAIELLGTIFARKLFFLLKFFGKETKDVYTTLELITPDSFSMTATLENKTVVMACRIRSKTHLIYLDALVSDGMTNQQTIDLLWTKLPTEIEKDKAESLSIERMPIIAELSTHLHSTADADADADALKNYFNNVNSNFNIFIINKHAPMPSKTLTFSAAGNGAAAAAGAGAGAGAGGGAAASAGKDAAAALAAINANGKEWIKEHKLF